MRSLVTGLAIVVLVASALVLASVKPAVSEPSKPRPHNNHAAAMDSDDHRDLVPHAVCVLRPTKGSKTQGVIKLDQAEGKVTVTGEVRGLTPNSTHAIHIHEFGDVSAPDGTSAGSHYNPEGHDHGLPDSAEPRHAGDMGNLTADDKGVATLDVTFENFTIAGMTNPVLGRAIVVHEAEDDGGQPTGNAGGRIAVGVIGVANTKAAEKPVETKPAEKPVEPESAPTDLPSETPAKSAPAAPNN